MKLLQLCVGCTLLLLVASCGSDTSPPDAVASPDSVPSTNSKTTPDGSASLEAAASPDTTVAPEPPVSADESICVRSVSDWERARWAGSRTDVNADGNRHAPGGIDLASAEAIDVALPGVPIWVIADPTRGRHDDARWYVSLDDGRMVTVEAESDASPPAFIVTDAGPAPDGPPQFDVNQVRSAHHEHVLFDDPLPDTRVVHHGDWAAALVGPTDRYGHGVLGDQIEADAVAILNQCTGEARRISVGPTDVIEGISPMLIDVEGANPRDSVPEILVTVSNADDGARLVLFSIDGTVRAESVPIGRGNRWRNQLAAGPIGPNGEFEIIDVRTPHLGGIVEYFRIDDASTGDELGVLTRIASSPSAYTSHSIGSRNLDLAILVDANEDKLGEVLVPSRTKRSLLVLKRTGADVQVVTSVELGGTMTTNLATQWIDGSSHLAVGTADGRLRVWRPASSQ